ncbi:MAG: class I SAM-dependent DNA methyltransferase [Nocardioidaceae bacterium]
MTDSAPAEAQAPDFDKLYAGSPDPWSVSSSWYEQRKLAIAMACLPRAHYPRAWEPGCGPGFVSRALASRADWLVITDGSAAAVKLATDRCADLSRVRVELSALPAAPAGGPFDLVFVAEFLYYVPDLASALDALWSAAAPGADLLFVHWAHHPHDAYRSGPDMHADIAADASLRGSRCVVAHVEADFLLDVYQATV